jgi:hypothetical protein
MTTTSTAEIRALMVAELAELEPVHDVEVAEARRLYRANPGLVGEAIAAYAVQVADQILSTPGHMARRARINELKGRIANLDRAVAEAQATLDEDQGDPLETCADDCTCPKVAADEGIGGRLVLDTRSVLVTSMTFSDPAKQAALLRTLATAFTSSPDELDQHIAATYLAEAARLDPQ